MLSVFPELLFLSPFAPLILRIALAITLAQAARMHARRTGGLFRTLAALEAAIAIALFFGAWTQPAALLAAAVAGVWIARKDGRPTVLSTALLALAIALSLTVTGPGALAMDLPL